ncbi:MAG: hypothetical protein UU48_C0001G0083 [Candidatus Uhrbacteria bacterium GW2011_GWF2_41_16]|uniref:CMP/dCMP-type deaminase domain-containing protein n=2 Tax=Candidatus Uhriibacteriota TaxID=1752732 RepID=A0A0G0VCW9_9BACT|nr:MAG: hypothetical protein UU31_C0002G0104 [Candidatus Uhrbacteria bacterium GW2011_GWA2_41_10]KKR87789.1 MAG: hypothetical protein UU35_C0001G0070 [Candidatus Uhrbacteria bacterium GW2011_GWC2_41_11]KKR98728.1 MAG: hypothetical protein UU48_C0001G0083 [Candidatus Uhrbacteria bacterium GW2011_GWF2_41_16]
MNDIAYPYLPPDRGFSYISEENPFMQEAKHARQTLAGDSIFPVGTVLVRDGEILARAGNGYNRGSIVRHICPRVVFECPSGQGYDLCHFHDPDGHAEQMVIKKARESGIDPIDADIYTYGHWWACESCWNVMMEAGIKNVYVLEDAHERFTREKVYAEVIKSTVRHAYISGALSGLPDEMKSTQKRLYELLADVCTEVGCEAYVPHLHTDPEEHPDASASEVYAIDMDKVATRDVVIAEVSYPSFGVGGELVQAFVNEKKIVLLSKKGMRISRFVLGNPAVVYHIEYEDETQACRMLKNVLKQI